jgi:hypothetical protein
VIAAHPAAHAPDVVEIGARYEMDTQSRIRVDLLAPQLLPAAKQCVRGSGARGHVALEIEIARGEVIVARADSSTVAESLLSCLRDAAYALTVPTYTLTDGPDTIHLIRYPIQLSTKQLSIGEGLEPIDIGNVEDPLGDLSQE